MSQQNASETLEKLPNMLEYALEHPNAACVWIETTDVVASLLFRCVFDHAVQQGCAIAFPILQRIELENGSVLHFLSVDSYERARGMRWQWLGYSKMIEEQAKETIDTSLLAKQHLNKREIKQQCKQVAYHLFIEHVRATVLPDGLLIKAYSPVFQAGNASRG